jgi:hypothetical protein
MNNQHQYLPLDKISPGMVLADNLLDKLGHVLLPAGTSLTESMLSFMPHHGIHQLSILITETAESAQEMSDARQKKLDRLKTLFRQEPYDQPTSTLMAYLQKYRSDDAL